MPLGFYHFIHLDKNHKNPAYPFGLRLGMHKMGVWTRANSHHTPILCIPQHLRVAERTYGDKHKKHY